MVLSLWPVVAAGKAKGKSDGRKDQTTSGHTGEERRGGVWGTGVEANPLGGWANGWSAGASITRFCTHDPPAAATK